MKKALIFILSVILIAGTAVSIINSRKDQIQADAPADRVVSESTDQSAIEPVGGTETTPSQTDAELITEPEIVSSVYYTWTDQDLADLEGNWQAANGNIVSVNRYGTCWIHRADGSETTGRIGMIAHYDANNELVRTDYGLSSFVHVISSWSLEEELDTMHVDSSGNLILYSDPSTSYVRTGDFEYISQERSPAPVLRSARSGNMEIVSADADWEGGYHYHRCSYDKDFFVNSIAFSKSALQFDYNEYSDPYGVVFRMCAARLSGWEVYDGTMEYNEACSQKIGRPVYVFRFKSLENESTRQWFMLGFDTEGEFYVYSYDFPVAMTEEMSSVWADDIAGLYLE